MSLPPCLVLVKHRRQSAKPTHTGHCLAQGEWAHRLRDISVSVIALRHHNRAKMFRDDFGDWQLVQIDRFANINTTVIGDYNSPAARLPGAGGAPEIAASSGEVLITLRQNKRSFVEKLDFVTSCGHLSGGTSREQLRFPGRGPAAVITNLGILIPDSVTKELTLTSIHHGISVECVLEATGWPLKVSPHLQTSAPPSAEELSALRNLQGIPNAG